MVHLLGSKEVICYIICFLQIKKEARGINDDDLGEVQDIGQTYIVTQNGIINREKFFLPKYLVKGYDGDVLKFRISEEEAKNNFVRDIPPSAQDFEI